MEHSITLNPQILVKSHLLELGIQVLHYEPPAHEEQPFILDPFLRIQQITPNLSHLRVYLNHAERLAIRNRNDMSPMVQVAQGRV